MRCTRSAARWLLGATVALAGCGPESATSTQGTASLGTSQARAATGTATGALGAWQALSPMPHSRANHCAVASQGYLWVLGGNFFDPNQGSFVNVGTVDAAPLLPDGTLGPWVQSPLPGPMSQCTAAAGSDGALYIVDAVFDDDAHQGARVWRAFTAANGTVGAWKAIAQLVGGVNGTRLLSDQAVITGARLVTLNADIRPDGSGDGAGYELNLLEPAFGWSQRVWSPNFRGHALYAFSGQTAYALGGYTGDTNDVVSEAYAIPLFFDETARAGIPTTSMPQPTAFGDAVAVDGYVFVIGGKAAIFGANGVPDAFSAPIAADGTLGDWSAASPLPQGRTDHRVTLAGDFVYVTGGGFDGPGLDSVFVARARF